MTTKKLTKLLALYLPYLLLGLAATNFGEAWRLAEGKELGDKIMSMMGTVPLAFANPLPSLHPLDLLVGLCCGAGLRLAVYLRGKNAKKYRHGIEYGSARWGTAKDIEPFMAPKFSDNIILTKTERLMMSNRPPDPKNARNKNVLVVGGSGSGKTRFWLKPNLLQCHSSYVVTDPKGSIVVECGNALLKNGYKVRILNTINFKKSMHYNPFAYVHSEKDKELDDLKAETILVIRGVSALDKELLGTLVAEAREALETLEKQLVQAQEEYEEATKTAKRSNYICNELFTWADVYDTANHDERRAILQQFIKEIRVRKDYEISITLNASFDQVEQLKSVSIYDGAEIFEEISEKGA